MRRSITQAFFAAAAAGATITTLSFAAAPPAGASLNPHITQDRNGEAGYYVADSGGWRIRDAHYSFVVTPAMRDLNGTKDGAVGAQLCDPNSSQAAQAGLVWNPVSKTFEVHYFFGAFGGAGRLSTDECIINGLLVQDPEQTPRLLAEVGIHGGDHLTIDVYYSPTGGYLQFTASDVTQNVTRQAIIPAWQIDEPLNFYEAGVGVLASNLPALTPPATNIVAPGLDASFNSYSATAGHDSVIGGWETKQAETVNGGGQVIVSPNSTLNPGGNRFGVFEGGITS